MAAVMPDSCVLNDVRKAAVCAASPAVDVEE